MDTDPGWWRSLWLKKCWSVSPVPKRPMSGETCACLTDGRQLLLEETFMSMSLIEWLRFVQIDLPLCLWSNHTLKMERIEKVFKIHPCKETENSFWKCQFSGTRITLRNSITDTACLYGVEIWVRVPVLCVCVMLLWKSRKPCSTPALWYSYWCRHSPTIGSWELSKGCLGSCSRVLPQFSCCINCGTLMAPNSFRNILEGSHKTILINLSLLSSASGTL